MTATVYDTLVLADSSHLALLSGSKLLIKAAGKVYVAPGASLDLQGGAIEFEGSPDSALIVSDSAGIRGKGTIINPRISFRHGFTMQFQDSITFEGGGILHFNCDKAEQPQKMEVYGSLRFTGESSTYQFGSCLDTLLVESGSIETTESVTLLHLPDLVAWSYGTVRSLGDTNRSCRWLFRDSAHCDIYGRIVARYTEFAGSPIDSLHRWDGIFVSMPGSSIDLDSCRIHQIRVIPDWCGTAIHLYNSPADSNLVRRTLIERIAGQGEVKEGNGIFLQPDISGSSLAVQCSRIAPDWWTGIGSVFSGAEVHTNQILYNRVGIDAWNSSNLELVKNCIENHMYEGVRSNQSTVWLARALGRTDGDNRIFENDSSQINGSCATFIFGQSFDSLTRGRNNISAASRNVKRLILDSLSFAWVVRNWWGETDSTDAQGNCTLTQGLYNEYFTVPVGGTLYYQPLICAEVHPYCNFVCQDEESGGGGGPLPPSASNISQLPAYALAGNFAEVYRLLGTLMNNPLRSSIADRAVSFAVYLESEYLRKHPDSLQRSASRLLNFLEQHFSRITNPDIRAALLGAMAGAHLRYGDPEEAERKIVRLRSDYPQSIHAGEALRLLLLVSMAKRDSSLMTSTIGEMSRAGYSASDMHIAYTMRYGYLRVRPRSYFRKLSHPILPGERNESGRAGTGLSIHNYPNPCNPTTIIEYTLPGECRVRLRVTTTLGRIVGTIDEGWKAGGMHSLLFDASDLPAGMYLNVLDTSIGAAGGRMFVVK